MKLVSIHFHFWIAILLAVSLEAQQAEVWSLQKCIDTAQVYNKTLQIGRNAIDAGHERHMESRSGLLPKVSLNADYKYYTDLPYQLMPMSLFGGPAGQFKEAQIGVPHTINANVQVVVPLYNPQVYGAIKTTALATDITELQYQKSEEQVFFEISNLYYNAEILQYQVAFSDSNLANAERLLRNILVLREQNMAKETDVNKARLQVSLLSVQHMNAQSKLQQVMNVLSFMMGVGPERSIKVESEISTGIPVEYAVIPIIDLKIARTRSLLLQSEIRTLRHSRLPTVFAYATYGTMGFGYYAQPVSFLNFYPVGFAGVQLNYPLFTGMATARKIKQKKIELQNNQLEVDLLTAQNAMQTENARLQRNMASRSIELSKQQVDQAQKIYDQTTVQLKNGTATITDVLVAENAIRESQQNYINALVDFLKADLELKKLTGNLH